MTRVLTIIAVLAALVVPSATLADDTPGPSNQSTAQQRCRDQLKSMGAKDFRALYGANANGKNAFGKCVSKLTHEELQGQQNAAEQCRAERSADPAAFAKKYGTNPNGKNAFGKCVSQKAQTQSRDEQETTLNAAQECKAERTADPAAFRDKYGTNHNKRNAFGKCVAAKVKEK
ncbi:MAG: hypothetical protein H0W87_06095 [Actinobacteria bacterium]|nr:hypothetical protein [Actinomycetota bacterium]